jgi:hypothetical protein
MRISSDSPLFHAQFIPRTPLSLLLRHMGENGSVATIWCLAYRTTRLKAFYIAFGIQAPDLNCGRVRPCLHKIYPLPCSPIVLPVLAFTLRQCLLQVIFNVPLPIYLRFRHLRLIDPYIARPI